MFDERYKATLKDHQCSSSAFQKMSREEHKDFPRNRVMSGVTTGVIYYVGELPVAW